MNPMAVEAIGAIVRWLLTFGGAYLVKLGIWNQDDAAKYIAGATLALISLGWSLYQKYGSRLKLLTAMATPGTTTEHLVEMTVAAGHAPSVTTDKGQTPIS